MKYKIIKSKKWQNCNPTSKLPSPIWKLHSSDKKKNPYMEYQDVLGTSKTVWRGENRVTIIPNLAFHLLRIKGLPTPTMSYLQSACK